MDGQVTQKPEKKDKTENDPWGMLPVKQIIQFPAEHFIQKRSHIMVCHGNNCREEKKIVGCHSCDIEVHELMNGSL